MSHDLACALIETDRYVYNLQFYCITEEVMLAEENKNSGRSPLDGKFTHFGWLITSVPTKYFTVL